MTPVLKTLHGPDKIALLALSQRSQLWVALQCFCNETWLKTLCRANVIITGSGGIRGAKTVELKSITDAAVQLAEKQNHKVEIAARIINHQNLVSAATTYQQSGFNCMMMPVLWGSFGMRLDASYSASSVPKSFENRSAWTDECMSNWDNFSGSTARKADYDLCGIGRHSIGMGACKG